MNQKQNTQGKKKRDVESDSLSGALENRIYSNTTPVQHKWQRWFPSSLAEGISLKNQQRIFAHLPLHNHPTMKSE